MTFRLIIAGSRNITVSPKDLFAQLDLARLFWPVTHIVSGCARGADRLGEHYARSRNLSVDQFPADWDTFGKSAGPRRNKQMLEHSDGLFAIWDGKSRGTQHMINITRTAGKPVRIYVITPEEGFIQ
jgi:hypothetical protein